MRVIVLGSGVIGVASAYYLARQGAEVTVLDRQSGPAEETSFGNAGQISPGYSTPWAAPGIPFKAVKWMFQHHAPLAINLDGSMWQLQWMAQMLKNCNPQSYAVNKERMMRVAEYSRDCLRELRKIRVFTTKTAPKVLCSYSVKKHKWKRFNATLACLKSAA